MTKLITFLILAFFVFGGYLGVTAISLPNVRHALEAGIEPSQTSQILASDRSVIMSYGKYQHKPVPLDQMQPMLIESLLATEDRRFYMHKGVDPIGILRAIVKNVTSKGLHEGGSTLTQQLARNIFLSNERSLQRKIKEAMLAIKIEQQLTKEQILELYLNNVYFGEGAYGVGAASNIYFGKTPSQLTTAECALLAGLPQAPSLYSPFVNPELAKKRRNEVLQNLVETGKLQQAEADRYKQSGFHLNPMGRALSASDKAPFFNRYVITQVLDTMGVDEQTFWQQGLKIQTTLDPRAQQIAERQIGAISAGFGRKQQTALLSLNADGGMIAYVGGKNFSQSQFDRVSQAKRLAGSLFKIFVYTTAIEQGMSPTTVYKDEAVSYGEWKPENYDKGHHGYMTLAQALAQSNNIIAVKLLHDLTPDAVITMAHKLGIKENLQPNLSLALGAADVSLLEMTSAFSAFSTDGILAEPFAIDKITDRTGHILYQHQPRKQQVLQRPVRDTMVTLMQGVVKYGTGKGANIGRPMAGKTGTSDDYRDAWFIGYTPGITTGVWVGNDDNTKMPGITGGSIPARIWRGYMARLLSGMPAKKFDLSYAKPVEEKDFYVYNLQNLSHSEAEADPEDQTQGDVKANTSDNPEATGGRVQDPNTNGEAPPSNDIMQEHPEDVPPIEPPSPLNNNVPDVRPALPPPPSRPERFSEQRPPANDRFAPSSQPITRPQRFEPNTGWSSQQSGQR